MGSLAPFLPSHLVRALAGGALAERLPRVEKLEASLLVCDIAGFTALTEKLQTRGREGAEEITDIIRASFRPAIETIHHHGGSILSFGGDALLVFFPGAGSGSRALAAAERVREHFQDHGEVWTSAGAVRLQISQALHHGRVTAMHLGRPERRQYLVCGAPLRALARLEARANAGQILLSPAARRSLGAVAAPDGPGMVGDVPDALVAPYVSPHVRAVLGHFEGEYRHAVMLFLETKGSSSHALQPFLLALHDVLDRYEGILVSTDLSSEGTKWLCAFGAPVTHEDDVARAARAALDLLRAAPERLRVRGGMDAGIVASVWMGAEERRSYELMGDVTNTAARAAAKAAWGEVLVTEEMRLRLDGVTTVARGAFAVKGKARALELHALSSTGAAVKQIRVSVPMIGRDAELAQVVHALERARLGEGSAIGIRGDAGMGKSRLKYEAARRARELGFAVHEGRAIGFGSMPYLGISELVRQGLGLSEHEPRVEVLRRVAVAAERLGLKPVDRQHLAELLGARPEGSHIDQLKPSDVRLNNMIAIRAYVQALAREQPRLLVLEDLHWADGASREAISWLAQGSGESRFVLLLLYRPGYEPPEPVQELALRELPADAVDELTRMHLGQVPEQVTALLRERATGNPFYVEEVVRHLVDAGILRRSGAGYDLVREPGAGDLPGTIEAIIAARLDRLAAGVRQTAQRAAVIGRSFLFDLLARLPEVGRQAELDVEELCARELCFERTREPRLEYIFKHALTRDVAYASILGTQRRRIHREVADGIEQLFGEEREAFLSMLGHHREHAGQKEEARACYLAAARLAVRKYAHEEGEQLFDRYLALVERESMESIEVRRELAAELQLHGRLAQAETQCRRAILAARELGARSAEAMSCNALGNLLMARGRTEEAWASYEESLAYVVALGDRAGEGKLLGNLGILCRALGRADEARAYMERARAIAEEVGDLRGEGVALSNLASLLHEQGRMEEARVPCLRSLEIHRQVGNRRAEANVLSNLGILDWEQGRLEAARAHYEQGLAINREMGDRRFEGHALGNLGSLVAAQGALEEAGALLDQALAITREVGDRPHEGVVLGNLGDLRHQQGRLEEAGGHYAQALGIQRAVGDRRLTATLLVSIAAYELLTRESPDRAEATARECDAAFRGLGEQGELCKLLAIRGHIALARGDSPSPFLDEACRIAGELGAPPESAIARAVARLARAAVATEAREPLICGHVAADLTSGQVVWLRTHRPRVIPA